MEDWKFSEIRYERQDYETLEKRLIKAKEDLEKAESFEEAECILLQKNEMDYDCLFYETVAYVRNSLDTSDTFL